jgi:hypothetical protein
LARSISNLSFWAQLGSTNIKRELLGSAWLEQIKIRATLARLSSTTNCWLDLPCLRVQAGLVVPLQVQWSSSCSHHHALEGLGVGGDLLSLLLVGEGPLAPPETVLLVPVPEDGDLVLFAVGADTGTSDPLALESLRLELVWEVLASATVVSRVLFGGHVAGAAGEGAAVLQERCLGRVLGW